MKTTIKNFAAGTILTIVLLFATNNINATELSALSNETEASLKIEKWMTDEELWNSKKMMVEEFDFLETESPLQFESWMTNSNLWNSTMELEIETEQGLELENWMIDASNWVVIETVVDDALTVESWMTDKNIW